MGYVWSSPPWRWAVRPLTLMLRSGEWGHPREGKVVRRLFIASVVLALGLGAGSTLAAEESVSPDSSQVEQVAVPAIDGLDTISASLALRDARLGAATTVASSDSVPASTVFDQSPAVLSRSTRRSAGVPAATAELPHR